MHLSSSKWFILEQITFYSNLHWVSTFNKTQFLSFSVIYLEINYNWHPMFNMTSHFNILEYLVIYLFILVYYSKGNQCYHLQHNWPWPFIDLFQGHIKFRSRTSRIYVVLYDIGVVETTYWWKMYFLLENIYESFVDGVLSFKYSKSKEYIYITNIWNWTI